MTDLNPIPPQDTKDKPSFSKGFLRGFIFILIVYISYKLGHAVGFQFGRWMG